MIENLIIWTSGDYILLFILGFLPLLNKISFWLYTIQLKEYRWDRFREYLSSKQWKSALFNIFFVIEFILIIFTLFLLYLYFTNNAYTSAFYGLFYQMFFWFLIIENIFVIWKILRKRILKPKITTRLIILSLFIIIWLSIDFYYFCSWNLWNYTYIYILWVFLLVPVMIFLFNFISLPLVNYKKNKLMKRAILKSKNINSLIKISITGSYWKSSVKEFLSSILEQDSKTLKTPDNINTELWVSSVVLSRLSNTYKYFIAEIWAYRIGEIKTLGKIVNHKYWFLTAIWNQHLWLFGSINNTKKAKFEILEKVIENNWKLYVNWDNQNIVDYLEEFKIDKKYIISYWVNWDNLNAKSSIIEIKDWLTKFELNYKGETNKFITNQIWEHNIVNITWILAFCIDIWISIENLKKYLLNIKWAKNTCEISEKNWIKLINDTYNLSEEWLLAWINILNSFKWNKILVMDDILELWDKAESIHENIWEKLASEKKVDEILFCWVNYKENFISGLLKWWFDKKNILTNLSDIKENSVILFEGKKAKIYLDKI